ncbi:MAG: putative dehydrogenase [Mariniblastus sp.]|jgi:predicted dehydrogenase
MKRRQFLETSAAVAAFSLPLLKPTSVIGANERINIGVIGVGGRGASDLAGVAHENIVALCDVDEGRLNGAAAKHPKAEKYFDYRKLLDQKNLDAVVIATPDHHHAPATVRAIKRGLHVYCEKPLTHTVNEARLIADLTAKTNVATQMGTQNHEHPGYIRTVELIKSGAIGSVTEVHVITDRPGRWWAQGVDRPKDKPEIPTKLNWDLWLGPAANRDYHPAYVPFKWRGWWDFGCGAIGDMAIHLMDPAFWSLELGGPVKVTSQGPAVHALSGPTWMITHFEFGERTVAEKKLAPVDVYWYEGTAKPDEEIAAELPMNGTLFIGEQGKIAVAHGGQPKLLPENKFVDFKYPDAFLPKSPGHHQQWIDACKTGSRTGSNFGYACSFTEIVLLGNVAYRTGQTIEYDPAKGKVTNIAAANDFLGKSYRKGWEV